MRLTVAVRQRDGVSIIDLRGRIVRSQGANLLREHRRQLLGEGRLRLVINFTWSPISTAPASAY